MGKAPGTFQAGSGRLHAVGLALEEGACSCLARSLEPEKAVTPQTVAKMAATM